MGLMDNLIEGKFSLRERGQPLKAGMFLAFQNNECHIPQVGLGALSGLLLIRTRECTRFISKPFRDAV
jgi:hypothetical protein